MDASEKSLTELLAAAADGDPDAVNELFPLVYDELRAVAARRLKKLPPGQTLQTTALVHEAYLRLAESPIPWEGRAHFFNTAAQVMRNVLVDAARRKGSQKRGGDRKRVDLEFAGVVIEPPEGDVLAIDEALAKLEGQDPDKAQLVLLRYFIGLTTDETADVLGVSASTVERQWRFIRAWLLRELGS